MYSVTALPRAIIALSRAPAWAHSAGQVANWTTVHVNACYTGFSAARKSVESRTVANQNITLSLPEEELREARVLAARRGTSVSQLLAKMLSDLVDQESGYAQARERSLRRLNAGTNLGTGGQIDWSRDSIHER
jgi:hypothetical protein